MEQALHTSRWFGFVCGVFFSVVQEISHNLGVCYMYLKHFNKVTKHSASLPDRGGAAHCFAGWEVQRILCRERCQRLFLGGKVCLRFRLRAEFC